jgi:hypothetical protein
LYSRNQNDFKKALWSLLERHNLTIKNHVIERGHTRFEWLVNRGPQEGAMSTTCSTCCALETRISDPSPLSRRKSLLQKLLRKNDTIRDVDHITTEGIATYAAALAMGLEGIVAKNAKSPYIGGPTQTWHWQKIKNRDYKRQRKEEFRQKRARL